MTNYKWQLRKSSRKEICPSCGQKRFVPYVSAADGKTIAGSAYGRCDREQNCGYHKYPTNDKSIADIVINTTPKKTPPKANIRFNLDCVLVDTRTPLFDFACKLVGTINALDIWKLYKIGKDDNRTLFWEIAKDGSVRAGKSIPYAENGHRVKDDKMPASWLHKSKKWNGKFHGEELQQCFFGEHLLNDYPNANVVIVESEKTAALMSAYTDNDKWIWLACGGSQGLQNDIKNESLNGRNIWLMPDNKQYFKWLKIANKKGWKIFSQIEEHPIFDGCDILDMVESGIFGDELIYYLKQTQ